MFRRIKLPEEMPSLDLSDFLSEEEYKKKLMEELTLIQNKGYVGYSSIYYGGSNVYGGYIDEAKDWKW